MSNLEKARFYGKKYQILEPSSDCYIVKQEFKDFYESFRKQVNTIGLPFQQYLKDLENENPLIIGKGVSFIVGMFIMDEWVKRNNLHLIELEKKELYELMDLLMH